MAAVLRNWSGLAHPDTLGNFLNYPANAMHHASRGDLAPTTNRPNHPASMWQLGRLRCRRAAVAFPPVPKTQAKKSPAAHPDTLGKS